MTYEQILKEFDEQFIEMYSGDKRSVKSFLKQSFIKYLQSEVEFVDTLPSCRRTVQIKKHLLAQIKELEV